MVSPNGPLDFNLARPQDEILPERVIAPRLDDAGREALRLVAADIVTAFRGEPNRRLSTRKEMRWGSKGSLSLVIGGPKDGLWFDHESGRGGDIIEFIRFELNCSFTEALDYAAQYASELYNSQPSPQPASRPAPQQTVDDDEEERIARALAIWCDAGPLRGTLADRYLQTRCILLPSSAPDALRFHPHCPWGTATAPALIGLITDALTNEPTGIMRVGLTEDGRKIAPRALGVKADGAVKLSRNVVDHLVIAEGIETALSATTLGYGPAWSVIDAVGIAKFPVLPGIERLTIAVDHDASGTGQKAAEQCKRRWLWEGRKVSTILSQQPGDDLNDFLQRRACEAGNA
jgi:putative DNA primase/helicase